MIKNILLVASMLTAGTLPAQAPPPAPAASQDGPWSLRARMQFGIGSVDGVENGLNLGVNYGIPVGLGLLNVGLDYQQFFGSNYDVAIPANDNGLTYLNSEDSRKHTLNGYALRLGYQHPFSDDWSWQAGVCVNRFRIVSISNATYGAIGAFGYWNQTIDQTRVSLSPFAGVRWDLNEYSAFECNLMLATYTEDVIYPIYGATGVNSATTTKAVRAPKIELGYIFKF